MSSRPAVSAVATAVTMAITMASITALSGCAMAMLSGAAGGGGSTASQETRSTSRNASDDAMATAVRSKLQANPALKPFNLAVDTHEGIVTLRGQVNKVGERDAAQAAAVAVKGVKSVQNLVTVR
ncbi:MAG TPA: BON domain-containing protein [Steroidobacteraceae bacterium]|nr:BON domain-containing protein [Steroidobacteraceae bacterium]